MNYDVEDLEAKGRDELARAADLIPAVRDSLHKIFVHMAEAVECIEGAAGRDVRHGQPEEDTPGATITYCYSRFVSDPSMNLWSLEQALNDAVGGNYVKMESLLSKP